MGFVSWLLADEIDIAVRKHVTDARIDDLVRQRLIGLGVHFPDLLGRLNLLEERMTGAEHLTRVRALADDTEKDA